MLLAVCWLISLLSIALQFALVNYAKANPQWTESVYSRGIYPKIAAGLQGLHRFFPFSLAELLLLLFAGLAFAFLVQKIPAVLRQQRAGTALWSLLRRPLCLTVTGACLLALLFQLSWGLNYYRLPLADQLGLSVEATAPSQLRNLTLELIRSANALRSQLFQSANGAMALSGSLSYYFITAPSWYQTGYFDGRLPLLKITSAVKPVVLSGLMSFSQITGFYFPFTGEANVNLNVPDEQIPATMAHELAHRHGYAREDEANFIAYLVTTQPFLSPEVRYSGTMLALSYCLNACYQADPAHYATLYAELNDPVAADFAFSRSFWQQYEGPVEQVSTGINNGYLQSNGQSDGVASYGRMVDLLLALARSK
ncbi:MAG: DUF3810 domain-containing protein [Negativicutes bacterium]|nr:DUF3810 domain-containing protein [Negativicutes bacterium]